MSQLKDAIFQEIRDSISELSHKNDDDLEKIIFNSRVGLRLSREGYKVFKRLFDIYVFDVPLTIKTKHILGLSTLEYPYYFSRKKLVVFSEGDALTIKLCGSVERFLENCYERRG
jgi:hypothetical protein